MQLESHSITYMQHRSLLCCSTFLIVLGPPLRAPLRLSSSQIDIESAELGEYCLRGGISPLACRGELYARHGVVDETFFPRRDKFAASLFWGVLATISNSHSERVAGSHIGDEL